MLLNTEEKTILYLLAERRFSSNSRDGLKFTKSNYEKTMLAIINSPICEYDNKYYSMNDIASNECLQLCLSEMISGGIRWYQ